MRDDVKLFGATEARVKLFPNPVFKNIFVFQTDVFQTNVFQTDGWTHVPVFCATTFFRIVANTTFIQQ